MWMRLHQVFYDVWTSNKTLTQCPDVMLRLGAAKWDQRLYAMRLYFKWRYYAGWLNSCDVRKWYKWDIIFPTTQKGPDKLNQIHPTPRFPKKKLAIGITFSSLKLQGRKGSNLNVFQQIQITTLKINMEHNSLEVWKIIFLWKWLIWRFQPLIFQGVYTSKNNSAHRFRPRKSSQFKRSIFEVQSSIISGSSEVNVCSRKKCWKTWRKTTGFSMIRGFLW